MPGPDAADRLYGLPLGEFVAARDALARELRAEGRREEASAVRALGRPSVAAWAVNQVVRSQPREARALWEAGDEMLAAQRELLAGAGDRERLREATRREQAALDPLAAAAQGLLDARGRGMSAQTLQRVVETLHAAAIDPGAREEVAAGRATRELRHVGLGAVGAVEPRERGGGSGAVEEPAPAPQEEQRAAAERDRREAAERTKARAAAEREARAAARELERAQRAAARTGERLERARAEHEEQQRTLDQAQKRRREAHQALADLEG